MEVKIDLMMRIDIYSHFFKVTKHTPRITAILFRFAFQYTQQNFQQKGGRSERVQGKTFASKTADNSEFRFHIGQLAPFKKILQDQFIEPYMYEEVEHDLYTPTKIPMKLKPQWKLREQQEEAKAFILENDGQDFHTRLATMPTGSGKGLGLDALIKIPGGWIKNGEIRLGQTVTAWDGTPSKVTGVYPQGLKTVFKITFKDGRTAECDIDHLWKIHIQTYPEGIFGKWKVVSTRELVKLMKTKGIRVYIPLIKPEDIPDVELNADPYIVGTLVGHCGNESIPDEYLNASQRQRLKLLRGILEVNGGVENGILTFTSKTQLLAENVQYLVRSLSGIAAIEKKSPSILDVLSKGELREYIVNIWHETPNELFVYKKCMRTNDDYLYTEDLQLQIKQIKLLGSRETQCIMIDHPDHLYVTNDFVVTHNTVVALASTVEIQERTLIAVLPKYGEKWLSDVFDIVDVNPKKDIMNIAGSNQVKGLVQLAKEKQPLPNFIVISLTTLQNFFKSYEENRFSDEFKEYGCSPEELCQILDIGNIIVDEAHEQIYSVFKLMLYTHVPKVIALSGTLISDDHFIDKIHHLMFPKEIRFDKVKMKKYIVVYPISYNFRNFQSANIRTTEFGSNNYSHMAFEKSILKRKDLTENYLLLIQYLIDISYMKEYQKGDKLAIYASSIDMCTRINDFIKAKYKHLDVRRYVEKDPYANVIEADIRVTTILSAGTAVDIPGLTTVIMTTNIKSIVSNYQTLGRLREIPNRTVRFLYLFSEQIQKQVDYHNAKKEAFEDRVALIKEFRAPIAV